MWSVLNGTLVNVFTVVIGSLAGLGLGARLPTRYQRIILDGLGLVTVCLGVDAAVLGLSEAIERYGTHVLRPQTYGARLGMVMVGSLIIGAIVGTALRLHERIEGLGEAIHRRLRRTRAGETRADVSLPGAAAVDVGAVHLESVGINVDASPFGLDRGVPLGGGGRFAEGFLSASVIFCVGPLTLLGCLANGARGDPSLLYIKAFLDGFCSMALASGLGAGVLASVLTIVVFQGGLALAAQFVGDRIPDVSLRMMSVVGGVVLLATALMILEVRKIPVANFLPAIFLPPLVIAVVEWLSPGTLLPVSP